MKSKMICIRLNLEKLTDRKVSDILLLLPSRRRSEYIRNAVIAYDNQEKLSEVLKKTVTEAMEENESRKAEKRSENNGGFNGFFGSYR